MELSRAGSDILGDVEAATLLALARLTKGASGRELARLSGMATHSSTRRILQKLVQIGLVTTEEAPNAVLYTLNRDHVLWQPLFEILVTPAVVEDRISQIVAEVAGADVAAVLFGSFARRDSNAWSDIDLALIFPDHSAASERDRVTDELQDRILRLTGNPVQVVAITQSLFRSMVGNHDPLVTSWSDEGRRVSGPELSEMLVA